MERKNALSFVQRQIGYEFKNLDLLEQAFTRRSYTEENGGENNEVLEFLGDKVLDFIVVKILSERFGVFEKEEQDPTRWNKKLFTGNFISEVSEGKLSEIKARLVNKNALAARIDDLGITDFVLADLLKMSKGDIANGVMKQPSVKEDLFEAILGAVALDSEWNLEELQNTVEVMLEPDDNIDADEFSYVQFIQDWVANDSNTVPVYLFKKARYSTSWYLPFDGLSQTFNLEDPKQNEVEFWCMMHIADRLPDFRGFGKSKSEARREACKVAYNYLDEQGFLPTIRDEIENPNRDEAIGQLEILARRGYFSIPTYDFTQEYDNNGNPVWKSECHIAEYDVYCDAESSSKKDAKKDAAYEMLLYVLGYEEKENE